jgi:SAM-dependent methyltransferase
MPLGRKTFQELVAEAEHQPFAGWDFSYLKDRLVEEPVAFDYPAEVRKRLEGVVALLDLGTGGGEVFSQFAPFPPRTFAAEHYVPNASIAARRLQPLGAQVISYEAPMENYVQLGSPRQHQSNLPFRDGAFDLVIDRHEAYGSTEVFRILRPGGRFLTQQCGGSNYLELNDLLGIARPSYAAWSLESAQAQLSAAGFATVSGREHIHTTAFCDVGAVVYYLRTVPWQVGEFKVSEHEDSLKAIHRRIEADGPLKVRAHHFLVEAVKGSQID